MADRRMFNRGLFDSSLMLNLAAANPDHELEAQRIWETLILIADDQGRGKYIPAMIRLKAFGGVPTANGRITIQMVEDWIKQIADDGCIAFWETPDGAKYFVLTKWEIYQSGVWHRGKSKIPEPPLEIENLCWKQTDKGIERESNPESDSQSDSESNPPLDDPQIKLKQSKVKEEYPPEVLEFTKNWFAGNDKVDLDNQADSLDKLTRIDGFPQEEVFKILTWVKSGTDQNAEFWRGVIGSFVPLRENKKGRRCNKYLNCKAAFEKTKGVSGKSNLSGDKTFQDLIDAGFLT